MKRAGWVLALALLCQSALLPGAQAQRALVPTPGPKRDVIGPYNGEFVPGGDGLLKGLPGYTVRDTFSPVPAAAWTLKAWVKLARQAPGRAVLAGVGDPATAQSIALALDEDTPTLVVGGHAIKGSGSLDIGVWHYLAATTDGARAHLYLDGRDVGQGDGVKLSGTPLAVVVLAPRLPGGGIFSGRVAGFEAANRVLPAADLQPGAAPQDDLIVFEQGAATWPIQATQRPGQTAPQAAWTLPKSRAPFDAPVAKPVPQEPALGAKANGVYAVHNWRLAEGPKVQPDGASLSRPGFDAKNWYAATVPGTVLTTLVDRGVYPDPTRGLNNMAIPESLAHQDYWYRSEFTVPAGEDGRHLFLNFNGINYAADVWLNGARLGTIKGAFIRGRFDVTGKLLPGRANAIAVKISPPSHPGIAHEQSILGGRGNNGGMQTLDGPTFVATEGWDWIPGIRDRNSGLWQDVEIESEGALKLGDAQIVTTLPKADNSVADVEIDVPVQNLSDAAVDAEVRAAFDTVAVSRHVTLKAHESQTVKFQPSEFPALAVANPKLWWPNGYGAPALHTAHLSALAGGAVSDARDVRFGMRSVTYEISLMNAGGELKRVALDFAHARSLNQQIMDVTHEHIRKIPRGWAYSLGPDGEASPAVTAVSDEQLTPYLIIRVNGVRIAARGGNIGMDDMMKRVDRAHLEPLFRLDRDAHANIVRNWVGQNTESVFFDLCDEYGLMILNDFWDSTQNSNIEAGDVPLFLDNARDTVQRFRNHPSIVAWLGRNEGVPQPALNEGLQTLLREDDGTRIYMPSSNQINLAGSGPYGWRDPVGYFTDLNRGFAVEVGTPSFPTLESWQRAMAKDDTWPIGDAWAYHDWHQDGGVAVGSFMDAMDARFGKAADLPDFERKAQLLEYDSYRAIFEGMNAGLWKTTSARLLWMIQPAWPSAEWQIMSSDYDTHGAYYGMQKASEPVHVQMNLPDYKVILVNNAQAALDGVTVRAHVVSLENAVLLDREARIAAPGGSVTDAFTLDLAPVLAKGPALVRLEARDAKGALLSDNFYWQAGDPATLQAMNRMPQAKLAANVQSRRGGGETVVAVALSNPARAAAIAAKLTLFGANGAQILPAYFSDNYVSLLPGESRRIEIRYPATLKAAQLRLRGWNVTPQTIHIP